MKILVLIFGFGRCLKCSIKEAVLIALSIFVFTQSGYGQILSSEEEALIKEYNTATAISLTVQEKQWLSENKIIRVAASLTSRPYEFIDEAGDISGISGSYLEEISKLLDVDFVWSGNTNWGDGIDKIKSAEAEILSFATPTKEREEFLIFTDSNMNFLQVIFARDGENRFSDLDFMDGSVLAVSKNAAILSYLKVDYPNIIVNEVDTAAEALLLVSNGEADGYIGNIPSTSRLIANLRIANVSVSGSTPYNVETAIAVRSDIPLLASSIQKAHFMISDEIKDNISSQWLSADIESEQNYELIVTIIVIAAVIITIIFVWAFSLNTEVKRRQIIEKKLLISQKEATEANRAKSTFLANMSHEIRTPLNAIIGFSEVMLSGIFGKIGHPKYLEYLRDIEYSGHHLETVINDILDLSKIEAGKWQLNETEFNLHECIDGAFKIIELKANAKNISFANEAQGNNDLIKIYGDQNAYMRIFINLLSNSVKFTDPGGNIIGNISMGFDGAVKAEIIDNGSGIPADRIEHVLTPFSQAHDISGMEKAGTGLGLPIVTKLSEIHGGSFSLSSELNVGTIATVIIPSSRVKAQGEFVENVIRFKR